MKILNKQYLKYLFWRSKSFIQKREAFYLGDYQALTRLIYGQPFFVDTRDISLTPTILLTGCWEPAITAYYRRILKPGMTVVDVGSHMGYYSVLGGSSVGNTGKVHAFEANPIIFETLFKNIFVNGLISSVTINNNAVYSYSRKLEFSTLSRATGGNSLVEFTEEYKTTYQENINKILIDSISLDEYFRKQPSYKVDVVKIDAEGSEPYIFKGMEKVLEENPKIVIFCEFNPGLIRGCGNEPVEFLKDLKRYGFSLNKIVFNKAEEVSIDNLINTASADLLLMRTSI